MNCEIGGFHLGPDIIWFWGLGYLSVECLQQFGEWRTSEAFAFVIAIHNFATLKTWLTYQCPSSWPVVITMKKKLADTGKKYRILAGPN